MYLVLLGFTHAGDNRDVGAAAMQARQSAAGKRMRGNVCHKCAIELRFWEVFLARTQDFAGSVKVVRDADLVAYKE